MKLHYIIILIAFTFVNCTDEIPLETNFKPEIYIFGFITNQTKQISILIQESIPLEASEPKYINDARISLFTKDSQGVILITDEFMVVNGSYKSKQKITPSIGKYYWIEVELNDGRIFKSSEEELLKVPVPINSITKVNDLVRVNFEDPIDDANYYRLATIFNLGEQSKLTLELSSDVMFNGNENAFIDTHSFDNDDITAVLANLNFYTYQYYYNLKEQDYSMKGLDNGNENGDPSQLFAPPPINLTGNIINSNTNKKVLGNFGAISISYFPN